MLCMQKPENPSAYYEVTDTRMIHFLMLNGIYPLYSDGNKMYFVRNGEFEKWIMEYKKSLGKEETHATEAM